jgi:Holliday junction resolvasome RuvABC endonuclease subunit
MSQLVPEGTVLWLDGWLHVGRYIGAIDCYRTSAGLAARWIIESAYERKAKGGMRSVGIDISKKEYSAAALAVGGKPTAVVAWRNKFSNDSEPVQLERFYTWLVFQLGIFKPDIIAVEELAVFMNKNTIRTLARREGVALLAAKKRNGSIVLNPSIGRARNAVFGVPMNTSKEVAWELMRERYPDFKFANSNQGGMDQADALTHALAAPTLLERG